MGYDLRDAQTVAARGGAHAPANPGRRRRVRQPRGELPAVRHRRGPREGGDGRALAARHRPGRALLAQQQRQRQPVDLHRPAHRQPVQHGRPARRAVPVGARGSEPAVRDRRRGPSHPARQRRHDLAGDRPGDDRAEVPAARREDRGQPHRTGSRLHQRGAGGTIQEPCRCRPASRSSSAARRSSSARPSAVSSSRRSWRCSSSTW